MTGVGVTPLPCWMMVSTPFAASTSSAVRCGDFRQRMRVLTHEERTGDFFGLSGIRRWPA